VPTDDFYKKIDEAITRRNYDFAIFLLMPAVCQNPGDLDARQKLRGTVILKLEDPNVKAPSKARVARSRFFTLLKAGLYRLLRSPRKAMAACEKHLTLDPYDKKVQRRLAQAAADLELTKVGIWICDRVLTDYPDDPTTLRLQGQLCNEAGEIHRALACFTKLRSLKPSDIEAGRMVKDLGARGAIQDGGWIDTTTFRDKIRDRERQRELEEESQLIKSGSDADREIDRMLKRIEEEPNRASHYVRLGDLYLDRRKYKTALETYEKAHDLDPQNDSIMAKMGDVKLRFIDEQVAKARDELEKAPEGSPEAADVAKKLKDLTDKRHALLRQEYEFRVGAYPTNMQYRTVLGEIYFDEGRYDDAIEHLQRSKNDHKMRLRALSLLGRAFQKKNLSDLAVEQFREALTFTTGLEEPTKEFMYLLGTALELSGKPQEAYEAYKKVYQVDIRFRDVADRMERMAKEAKKADGDAA
jgi:tetratricopeptide (TPR) repeat protein